MITRQAILDKEPCEEAIAWMNEHPGLTSQELWDICPRGDWLLWVCEKFELLDNRTAAQIACTIVREAPVGNGQTVWDLLRDERSRKAVEVTEAWLTGEASLEQVAVVAAAAYVAYAAYAAAAVAAAAVAAAAYAAYVAAAVADATARSAAYAAADAAARSAAAAADARAARSAIAGIVRRFVPTLVAAVDVMNKTEE